jgi:hypothetical protein
LHGPTTWKTIDLVTLISFVRKLMSRHLEGKEFAHPQTGAEVEQYKSSFAEGESSNQLAHFDCTQHGWDLLSLRALPYQSDWIAAADVMAHPVVEKDAHEISDLGTTRPCQRLRSQP